MKIYVKENQKQKRMKLSSSHFNSKSTGRLSVELGVFLLMFLVTVIFLFTIMHSV